ncbi:MAG: AAA family ATPase [Firmicutes bacterium HGW-Firmicutes-14]|nr:MAG: AAA family ATPase [Firmicutes bacterium HGW-Firmicutes-14]
MHIKKIRIKSGSFPTADCYPFNLEVLHKTGEIILDNPVTFFIGENGTGKSTLLKAVAKRCSIPIWKETERQRLRYNKYEEELYRYIEVEWEKGQVPGSFFSSDIFREFAYMLDENAAADPGMLDYFGGESLVTKSHGQCNMSYFRSRYKIRGLYFLDEPETALSPGKQIELLKVLREMSLAGHAQFIVATHSPILLALPGAAIFSFDTAPVKEVEYEETDYYRIYKEFLTNRDAFLK